MATSVNIASLSPLKKVGGSGISAGSPPRWEVGKIIRESAENAVKLQVKCESMQNYLDTIA
jgi:hypothetical protein